MTSLHCVVSQASAHCACCWTEDLADSGCKVDFIAPAKHRYLSGSRYQANHNHSGKLCDFVVFISGKKQVVLPIEMKSNNPRPSTVRDQLQQGADLAASIVATPIDHFRPLLVSKSLSPHAYRALQRVKVRFRGKAYPIRTAKCGTMLDALVQD